MNDKVKIALIAALAAIGVAWMILHYSPYQTCVRAKATIHFADSEAYNESQREMRKAIDRYGTISTGADDRPALPSTEELADQAQSAAEIACAGVG